MTNLQDKDRIKTNHVEIPDSLSKLSIWFIQGKSENNTGWNIKELEYKKS